MTLRFGLISSVFVAHVYEGCGDITDMLPFRSVGTKIANHYYDFLFFERLGAIDK